MKTHEFLVAVVLAIVLVAAIQALATYRSCRHIYKFDHAFCIGVFTK